MTFFESLLLGIMQGLTEFLPVSSSGHLEILSHILGLKGPDNLSFAIVLHGGTVLSTIVVFWKEICVLLRGVFKFSMNNETKFVLKILVSLIPIIIVGLTLKEHIEGLFGQNLTFVGIMLLVTSALLWFSSKAKERNSDISYRDAFVIGIAQAVAALPGLSRSGATISTGLLLGNRRSEIAKFSFLMVLIPIIGMNFLDIVSGDMDNSSIGLTMLITGFLSSFITGVLACKLMIGIVTKGKLGWFSLYCLVVGLLAIIWSQFFGA